MEYNGNDSPIGENNRWYQDKLQKPLEEIDS